MIKNSHKPLFSVIIPVYNSENTLNSCIESILCQSYKNFEILLVDDGSTDKSGNICDKYANSNSNIFVVHKKNGGLPSARKKGIELSKGKYIVYVDSDDRLKSNFLSKINNIILKHDNVDAIVFGFEQYNKDNVVQHRICTNGIKGYTEKGALKQHIYPYMIFDPSNKIKLYNAAWNMIFKRSILLQHHNTDMSFDVGEDFAYVYECLYYANSIYFLDDLLYEYNCTNLNSMSGASTKEVPREVFNYVKIRFSNYPIIQKQLDARYMNLISRLIACNPTKTNLSHYYKIDDFKPKIIENDLMDKHSKYILKNIINKKIDYSLIFILYKIYRKLDYLLWKVFHLQV